MHHCVVCVHKDCPSKGSYEIMEALEDRLEDEDLLYEDVEVHTIDCFSLCRFAPNVAVVTPEGERLVFSHVKLDDVGRIVDFLRGGARPTDLEQGPKESSKRVGLARLDLVPEIQDE